MSKIKAKLQWRKEEIRGCSSDPHMDVFWPEAVLPLDRFNEIVERIRTGIECRIDRGWLSDGKRPYLRLAEGVMKDLGMKPSKPTYHER